MAELLAPLSDRTHDGGLAASSGPIQPEEERVGIDLSHYPVHDLVDDRHTGVLMTLGRIGAIVRVVESIGSH